MYENMIKHASKKSMIEIRSEISNREQKSTETSKEYQKLLIDGMNMVFPKLHTRVSTKRIHVTGGYIYDDIVDLLKKGFMSPYIHPGVMMDYGINPKTTSDAVDTIQSLFSSGSLFSLYRDPIVNIFRSQLLFNEQ